MVDSSLNDPVVVQATRLDASILPRNIFSQSYLLYVINQELMSVQSPGRQIRLVRALMMHRSGTMSRM